MKLEELRNNRAKLWEQMKDHLDTHSRENGTMSAEDTATYEKMEADMSDLTEAIKREERRLEIENDLLKPQRNPIVGKPGKNEDEKTGRASDEYKGAFWNYLRYRDNSPEVRNALQVGTDTEGGYLVPDEYETTLVDALTEENIFRTLATVIQTSNGDRKIPVVASHGSASWIDEEGSISDSDEAFGQITIGAHKLGTKIKVSNELLNDSVFNLESYIAAEFGRRLGAKEEEAFFIGDGSGKPTGIFNSTGGAQIGVTAASKTEVTADELLDLFYSLKAPYRNKAVWGINDTTIKMIRKLKDGTGNYLGQPALTAGDPDLLLGKPVKTSTFVPSAEAGAKPIAFGDFKYYWIADRQGRTFKTLTELYAETDQTAFIATQRVDGKLILPEAIKVLKMHA